MEETDRRYGKTRDRALGLLSRREHSEYELTRKLLDKAEPPDAVAQVVERLKQENLLSDRRFADALVRSRTQRGYGPVKIRHELETKGIADALIDEYLDLSGTSWETILRRVWSKKYGGSVPTDYQDWAKQARFLQSRGFTSEQIRRVVSFQNQP